MIKVLCVPCMKGLEGKYIVRRESGNSIKMTCECCGRRRFCGRWEVLPRIEQ